MQPWTKTLLEAEDSLRELEDAIGRVRVAWPVTGVGANGPAAEGVPAAESLRQLLAEVSGIVGRCEDLPKGAIGAVESAWENLEANALTDWDAVGRQVLNLLTSQAEAVAQAIRLVRRGEKNGPPPDTQGRLNMQRSLLLDRARDFRDSWPWSTGNKPGDPEDAAAAQRALARLPPFEALARLAKNRPLVDDWPDED